MRLREWTFTIDDSEVEHKVTDILLYSDDDEKIELEFKPVFMPENGEMSWEDWNCFDSIRVYNPGGMCYDLVADKYVELYSPKTVIV